MSMATRVRGWTVIGVLETDQMIGFGAWRKLGDVISSISALGYHENI